MFLLNARDTGGDKGRAPRVLYFAVEAENYPRNSRVRRYLAAVNADVTVVVRPRRSSKWREHLALALEAMKHLRGYDLVILSEFSTNSFPLSWIIAKLNGAVHVVDFFVGKHETVVEDWKRFEPESPRARVLFALDRLALKSADVAFTDTDVRAAKFERLASGATVVVTLPVGSPDWAKREGCATELLEGDQMKVLYYGHYAALHGVDLLLDALVEAAKVVPIHATFVGDGTGKSELVARVEALGLAGTFTFVGFEEPDALMRRIDDCHIVLGVFGTSEKAASVIANKVWQGLSADRYVLTRESEALREIADIVGDRLVQVSAGNSSSIANGLIGVYRELGGSTAPQRVSGLACALEAYVDMRFDSSFAQPKLAFALGTGAPQGGRAKAKSAKRARKDRDV